MFRDKKRKGGNRLKRENTASERVHAVMKKTYEYRRRLEKKITGCLTAVCIALIFGLVGILFTTDTAATTVILGGCSSVLLYGSRGEYAIVGIVSFIIGAALAITALRFGKKDLIKK